MIRFWMLLIWLTEFVRQKALLSRVRESGGAMKSQEHPTTACVNDLIKNHAITTQQAVEVVEGNGLLSTYHPKCQEPTREPCLHYLHIRFNRSSQGCTNHPR